MKGELIKDIEESLIIYGQPNVPGLQTWPVLFNNTSEHWEKIKTAFINSCDRKPDLIRAWAYIQRAGIDDGQYPAWHTHGECRPNGQHCFQCGVLYLDRFKHGTIFKRGDKEIIGDPTPFVWHMFSPNDVHSAPKCDTSSNISRYVIAAEALNYI